jgi:hypothetical protein
MHGCCSSFQFLAGILHPAGIKAVLRGARLWCSQHIKYPGFLKKKFLVLDGTTRNCPKPRRISWRYLGHSSLAPSGQSKYLVAFPSFPVLGGCYRSCTTQPPRVSGRFSRTQLWCSQKNQIPGWLAGWLATLFFSTKARFAKIVGKLKYPPGKKLGSSGYYILVLFSKPRTGGSLIAKCS